MIEHASKLAVLLAVVLMAAVPAGAVDLLFTFENPPYMLGTVDMQDGWYAEDWSPEPDPYQPTPDVSDVDPLAGSQSMFFSRLPGDVYQRIWRSTVDQTITELMSYEFIAKVESGIIQTGLWDTTAKQFWGIHLNVEGNAENEYQGYFRFTYGWDCWTALDVEDCRAGNTYRILATLNFDAQTIRTIAQNLTDPSQPLVDSGYLEMHPGTTIYNANSGSLHTGIRIMGHSEGITGFGEAEGRMDDIGFNLTPVFIPGTLAGHVELQDFVGSNLLTPIRIELTPQGPSGFALTKIVYLDANNDYVLDLVDVGIYDVAFSGCGWLRTVVSGVEVSSENTTQCNVSLPNGDVDGDDEVTSTDLSVVLVNVN